MPPWPGCPRPVLILALALALGAGITGCCGRKPATDFNRFDGTANQTLGVCGIFAGFGTTEEPERWGALYSPISVEEYGALLCGEVAPEAYATCINSTWAEYRQARREPNETGATSAGPFAVMLEGHPLTGRYWSHPFAAGFRVERAGLSCWGGYDALAGDTRAIFQVACSDGGRGWAQVVRDRGGRDGVGGLYLADGRVGRIIFGPNVLAGAMR